MRQPVDTGRRENPLAPERFERVLLVGTHLRGRHYGQRSCVPHQQVEHMAAPTRLSRTSLQPLPTGSRPHMAHCGLSGNVHRAAGIMVGGAGSRTQILKTPIAPATGVFCVRRLAQRQEQPRGCRAASVGTCPRPWTGIGLAALIANVVTAACCSGSERATPIW